MLDYAGLDAEVSAEGVNQKSRKDSFQVIRIPAGNFTGLAKNWQEILPVCWFVKRDDFRTSVVLTSLGYPDGGGAVAEGFGVPRQVLHGNPSADQGVQCILILL